MKTKTFWFVITFILFLCTLVLPVVFAGDIQYLGIHGGPFVEGSPETFNQAGINEIANAIGTRGRADRKLAVSFTLNYLRTSIDKIPGNYSLNDVKQAVNTLLNTTYFQYNAALDYTTGGMVQSLKNILAASESADVPLIIRIDGTQWWEARPDLWNWWNDQEIGYNPYNINNVERFDWGTSTGTAVKIGWRNWGEQSRVAPAPNLGSPGYRAAQKECLDLIFSVIAQWYNGLPDDKKYLLGGIVLGWELSIWWNAFYYEGGNDLLNQPEANDPTNYPDLNPINPKPEDRRVKGLGYAAAQTLGIQTSGTAVTYDTGDAICADYLKFLIELAIQHGIPSNRLITHSFTTTGGVTGKAAVSDIEGVVPGWSWYGLSTGKSVTSMDTLLNHADGRPWAVIEMGSGIQAGYEGVAKIDHEALETIFAYRNNRYINFFNWDANYPGSVNYGVKQQPDRIEAIRLTLWEDSVSVGAQNGSLSVGTVGSAAFPVVVTGKIAVGTAITLNNINSVVGITLGTPVTTGYNTTLTIGTTGETPQGTHPLTLTIDGVTSNSFSLEVGNKLSLGDVKYYPNPLQPSKGPNYAKMNFTNTPPGTCIKIYTMLGQLVRELEADARGTAVWDGKNNTGEKAASGVYIVYMEDGNGNKKRIKVAVER